MLRKVKSTHNIVVSVGVLLAIVVIVLTVMGGYLYYFCYRTIYQDFLRGNQQRVTAIANRHESDMQITEDIVTQLSLSKDITGFLFETDAQKAIKLMDRLHQYTVISQFFATMFYQNHGDRYMFSGKTSVSTAFFLKYVSGLEEEMSENMEEQLFIKDSQLRILPEQRSDSGWIYSELSDDEWVTYFRTIPPKYEHTLAFFVPGYYYDKLIEGTQEERLIYFFYYGGQIVLMRGNEEVTEAELADLCSSEQSKRGIDDKNSLIQNEVEVGGKKFLFSAVKGETGILYGALQSLDVLSGKIAAGQVTVIALFVCCIFAAVAVVLLFSGKIVQWVKRVSRLLDEEGTYDLVSVEEGIQSLIAIDKKSKEESLLLQRRMFIRNFIRGDYNDRNAATEAGNEAKINTDYQKYIVVLHRSKEDNNESKAFWTILEMISNEKRVDGYGVHLISNNQNVFVLFGETEAEIDAVLEQFLDIEKACNKDYIIAVSNYHSDFLESSRAYLEADMAFDNHLLLDNNRIIRFGDILHKEHKGFSADSDLKQLKYAIQNKDMVAAEAAVSSICSKFKRAGASLYTFRIFYLDIIHILLSEWGDDVIEFDRFYNVFTLSQCMNTHDFYEFLCEICRAIIEKDSGKGMKENDIVRTAVAYMKENFQVPDLTMNALADYLGVSSAVLAVEFRNVMDMKPSDYLGILRMERAKELLCSTTLLIGEVSIAVGYEDPHVFMRRFKKCTGMTPKQYRTEQLDLFWSGKKQYQSEEGESEGRGNDREEL